EARPAVGKIEGPASLGDRIVRPWLEQAQRALGIGVGRAVGSFARTGPKDPKALLHGLVGDARVVADSPLGRPAQLVEDLTWTVKGKPSLTTERLGYVLDDTPVLTRLPWALHGLTDADDASLHLGDGALVLFLQRARQDNVCVARRFAHEEVDGDVEVQLLQG